MDVDFEMRSIFAPSGYLRAAINLGNPILASGSVVSASATGVSVDLATALALQLGVPLQLVVVDTAASSVKAVSDGEADVGFFAIDPVRGAELAFSAPYLLIEGCYVVPEASALRDNADVDAIGVRISAGKGSAYDLYLTRELKHAELVRAESSQVVLEQTVERQLDVAAGVRQQLESDMKRIRGFRFLPGRFMVIQQAMGIQKSRGEKASACLSAFVERMKAEGFVAKRMSAHHITGGTVAPLQSLLFKPSYFLKY